MPINGRYSARGKNDHTPMANVARATETVCQPWYALSSHNLNKRERANVNAHKDCRHSSASRADYWAVAPRHSGRVSVGWPLAPCADAARHGRVFRHLRRSYLCSATAVPITGVILDLESME